MYTIKPYSFVEELTKDNIDDYLFKVEMVGQWFTTQDVKPFCVSFEYRKVADIYTFIRWLQSQPEMFRRTGMCEEVTEIWRIKKHYKKDKPGNHEDSMILIWSKEKGWVDNVVYSDGIVNYEDANL